MKMKAAKLYGKNDLRIVETDVPETGANEILLRVKAAAVCGTDLRMFQNGAANIDETRPLTLCHEFSGVIEKLGNEVKGYKTGDRISVAPNIGCGICDMCASGNSHHCSALSALGVHADGGFAEFVRIPETAIRLGNATKLSDNISFPAAAANEAFACVYNAFERYKVFPGDTVLIIGAGAIGLMHAKLSKMAGAAKIILNDISKPRLLTCAEIEPDMITVDENLSEAVSKITSGRGVDVIITACSAQEAQEAAFELAALDGRVNFFGGLPKDQEIVPLNTNTIHYKQLTLTGTTRSSHFHYRQALSLIEKGLLEIDPLISHKHKLDAVHQAFENTAKGVGLKQCIVFD